VITESFLLEVCDGIPRSLHRSVRVHFNTYRSISQR